MVTITYWDCRLLQRTSAPELKLLHIGSELGSLRAAAANSC